MTEPVIQYNLRELGTYQSNTFIVRNPNAFKQWLDRWDMRYTLNLADGIGKTSVGDVMLLGAEPLQVTLQIMDAKPTMVMDDLLGAHVYNLHFLEELALFLIDNTAVLFQQLNFENGNITVKFVEVINTRGEVHRTSLTDLIPTLQRRDSRYNFIDSKEQRSITYYAHLGKPMEVRYNPPQGIIHRLLTFYEKLRATFEYDQFPQILVDRDCKVVLVFPNVELVSDFIYAVRNNFLKWYPAFNGCRIMLHERLDESSLVDFLRLTVRFNCIRPFPYSEIQEVIDTDNVKEMENFDDYDEPEEVVERVYFARFKTTSELGDTSKFGHALIRTPLGDYIYAYKDI